MTTIRSIQKNFCGNLCRRCINMEYGTRLLPKDCLYDEPYPYMCRRCGEVRSIVCGFRLSGKIKLLFRRSKKNRSRKQG